MLGFWLFFVQFYVTYTSFGLASLRQVFLDAGSRLWYHVPRCLNSLFPVGIINY